MLVRVPVKEPLLEDDKVLLPSSEKRGRRLPLLVTELDAVSEPDSVTLEDALDDHDSDDDTEDEDDGDTDADTDTDTDTDDDDDDVDVADSDADADCVDVSL